MTLYDFNILLKTQIFSKQDIIYLADKSLKVVKVCHVYLYIYIYKVFRSENTLFKIFRHVAFVS